MKWDNIGNWLNKVDDTVCWWFAVARGWLKSIWQRLWWNIRWSFLWLEYRVWQIGLFFRTLKLTVAHIEDEGKHTVIIRFKWESRVF